MTSLTSSGVCTRIPRILPQILPTILPPILPISLCSPRKEHGQLVYTQPRAFHTFSFIPCLCLPVPVSVWDVFELYLFVGWRREIQVGTGAECPAPRQTKSLQNYFWNKGSWMSSWSSWCSTSFQASPIILRLIIFTFLLILTGFILPMTLHLVWFCRGQGDTLLLSRVGMMV